MSVTRVLAMSAATAAIPLLLAAVGEAGRRNGPSLPPPSQFVREVDNPFFPLEPGTSFVYEGDKEGVPTLNVTRVTHVTRRILGVECTEVRDQAYDDGILAEDTFDWYAQDVRGNVWYFGERTSELDPAGNVISTEGTWEAGVAGARPGIVMEAHPRVGDRYVQEVAPGVAEDMAQILSLDKFLCVPYGCFCNLLLTKEWTPLHPGVVEHKYYARGIGFLFGTKVKGGSEVTRLVSIEWGDDED